jgi:Mn-dependent DtxR family transcriptional regulator
MAEPTAHDEDRPRKAPPLLTDTELRVYIAVVELSARGWSPTHGEICAYLGWSPRSRGSVNAYLRRLKEKGVIEGVGRSLRAT